MFKYEFSREMKYLIKGRFLRILKNDYLSIRTFSLVRLMIFSLFYKIYSKGLCFSASLYKKSYLRSKMIRFWIAKLKSNTV